MTRRPNHALQRTRGERRDCNRAVPYAQLASLGRIACSVEIWQSSQKNPSAI